jgi:hypothetical protein
MAGSNAMSETVSASVKDSGEAAQRTRDRAAVERVQAAR